MQGVLRAARPPCGHPVRSLRAPVAILPREWCPQIGQRSLPSVRGMGRGEEGDSWRPGRSELGSRGLPGKAPGGGAGREVWKTAGHAVAFSRAVLPILGSAGCEGSWGGAAGRGGERGCQRVERGNPQRA